MATHRGLYDFVAKEPNMLSFKKGDLFSVVNKSSNGWTTVKNEKGQKGMVPESYLESIRDKVRLALPVSNVAGFTDGGVSKVVTHCY